MSQKDRIEKMLSKYLCVVLKLVNRLGTVKAQFIPELYMGYVQGLGIK